MKRMAAVFAMLLTGVALGQTAPATQSSAALPPGEDGARARLNASPRHGEFVNIEVPGMKTPIRSYIVYPEVKDKAPVVVVTMEIFGLSDWLMAVTDQLAADGFIAIAPDYLSGKGPKGGGTEDFADRTAVTRAVQGVSTNDVVAVNNAVQAYGAKLPASNGKFASIGFCWGGGKSFAYAAAQPELAAAVVYYGTPPGDAELAKIKCPVMGFYGGNDARVTATVAPTEEKMKKLEKSYVSHVYEGAGHGFLRAQNQAANLKASQEAWPATIAFLKAHTK